ncbi:MAG TPA: sigma-70 family RNA polymerase sigma factor [Planctomycetota bacterium]|nr:sigma-70 family RNA polymerase sigma factor [Planctomycetota bacterium]
MSDTPKGSDEELVRRVREGDEAAARLLFDRHLPALRAKARARLPKAMRGRVAESDVIQDAWLAAFVDVGRFEDRGDGSFGKWLRGILAHKIGREIDRHVAARKRDVRRERRMRTGSVDGFGAAPGQSTPSEEAVSAEEQDVLRAAVATLPEDHATVVRLVHLEGLSLFDAGARMGRSADAARKLYGRALAAMAGKLRGSKAAGP